MTCVTSELYLNKAILYKTLKRHTCRAPHFQLLPVAPTAGFIWPPSLCASSSLGPGLPPSPHSALSGTCSAPAQGLLPWSAPPPLYRATTLLCVQLRLRVTVWSPPTSRQVGATAERPPDSYRALNHATPPTESLFGCLPPRTARLATLAPSAFFVAASGTLLFLRQSVTKHPGCFRRPSGCVGCTVTEFLPRGAYSLGGAVGSTHMHTVRD